MTFLNPFVLFGLAAAAIPILIHLFNVRKLKTIEFSTLTFLKELQKNKMRRIKIRQWLLLALRTLLILLIVLAFSRPALKGSFGSAGTRAKTTVIILFDNTASMILNNERGKFLSQAQTQALNIVSALQENDDLFYLRLSDLPNATIEEPTRDLKKIESLIRETEITYNNRSIEDGLRLASRLLQQSKNFNKEVYIITDGQATTLTLNMNDAKQTERLFEPQVRFFYTQLSQRQTENIAIEKATILPSLFQINKPFLLNVVVKNYGVTESKNHLVSITLGNERLMQKSVSLNGGESATLEFPITPSRTGFNSGFVEMESDLFESDDRWYFSVNIPSQIRVIVVSPEEKYSRYIATALNTANIADASSLLELTTTSPTQLTSTSLANSDVVIFSGIKELSQSQSEILQQYISTGGSLFFFPSSDTNKISYNYLKYLQLTDFQISKTSTTFENVDLQFPIFYGMFETPLQKNKITLESPSISASINARSETNLRSIISLSNGKNFLWQKEFGKGKVFGVAVPATTEFSDFPLKGIFVPLLYQSVIYLSSPITANEDQNYFVGDKIEFNSTQLKKGRTVSPALLQLYDIESRKIPLQAYTKTSTEGISQSIFTFEQATAAGIYSVQMQNDTLFSLPINVHRGESNGKIGTQDEIESVLNRLGIPEENFAVISADDNVETIMMQSRFGIELWRYFLILAALVALTEMFIAREPKQKV